MTSPEKRAQAQLDTLAIRNAIEDERAAILAELTEARCIAYDDNGAPNAWNTLLKVRQAISDRRQAQVSLFPTQRPRGTHDR